MQRSPSGFPPAASLRSNTRGSTASARLESVGLELPERTLSTEELMAIGEYPLEIDVERITGVGRRRVCEGEEDAYSLAISAARDCLARSRHVAEDLDLVISCSISRIRSDLAFQFEPPLSLAVKNAIGARRAKHFDIGNACAGMFTGLKVAQDFIARGACRRALVVSGEFVSNIGVSAARDMRSIRSAQMASLTVGDAGAAVLVEAGEGREPHLARVEVLELVTLSHWDRLCIGKPREKGRGVAMHTDAKAIHEAAIEQIVPVIQTALERAELGIDDIDRVVPHQTTRASLRVGSRSIGRALGIRELPQVADLVEQYGNTASTTHFLVLHQLLRSGELRSGERVMLLGMASGLVLGVVILQVGDLAEWHGRHH